MGSSFGCVKHSREAEPGGSSPLSIKRKLRFRRKHKPKKLPKGIKADVENEDTKVSSARDTLIQPESRQSDTETPTQVVLLSGAAPILGSTGTLRGSRVAILSPDPSPAWMGGLHQGSKALLGKESRNNTNLGNTTPGGGRVCRVQGRVQGVLERPCLVGAEREELYGHNEIKVAINESSEDESKGIVHIREVDGKLCVVRTVYPKDYGSPLWHNRGVEVHSEPSAASPVTEDVQKIQVYDNTRTTFHKGLFTFDGYTQDGNNTGPLQDRQSSGYASDVPLTSPETGGAVQTDWESSSDVLNSLALGSPISPTENPSQTTKVNYSGSFSHCFRWERFYSYSFNEH